MSLSYQIIANEDYLPSRICTTTQNVCIIYYFCSQLLQEVQQLDTAVCSTSYFILHTSPGCQGSKEQTSLRITQTTNTRYIVTVQRKETWDVLQFSRSTVALTAKERKKLSRRGRFHTQKLTFPLILIKDLICYPSQIPSLSHRYF